MRAWQVLQRPVPAGRDPDVVFVKDGPCWPALFVPLLWALFRQQWLFLLALLLAALVPALLDGFAGLNAAAEAGMAALVNVGACLFANEWRAWRLQAAGYRLAAVIGAPDQEAAERRWFTEFAGAGALPPARPARNPWLPLLGET